MVQIVKKLGAVVVSLGLLGNAAISVAEEVTEVFTGDSLAKNADGSDFHVGDCELKAVWEDGKLKNLIFDGASMDPYGASIIGLTVDVASPVKKAKSYQYFMSAKKNKWHGKQSFRQFLHFFKKEIKVKLDDNGQPAEAAIYKEKTYAYCRF